MRHLLIFSFLLSLAYSKNPNVVIIYADDVGWGDLSCYGSEKIQTPHLDQLASEGLRFTDGHCSAATCTPSRFSMLTGIQAFRHGASILPPGAPMLIKPNMFTLPDLFKQAGYNTAVIGKWHLGLGTRGTPVDWNNEVKPGPLEIGFDYSFLLPSTNDRVPCVYVEDYKVVDLDPADPLFISMSPKTPKGAENSTVYPDGRKDRSAMTYYESTHGHDLSIINGIGRIGYQWGGKSALWDDETMADVFVEKTQKYLSAQKEKEEPFFLYFASADIHVPRAPHTRFHGKTELGYRGDAMVQLDWCVGEIMKSLEENGFADDTIVIFSSDNGPVYDDGYKDGTVVKTSEEEIDQGHDGSGPYRGGKYQIYEGGTRVPFLVKWAKEIKPGVSDVPMNQIDFMASFANLLEQPLAESQGIDSRDHLSALLGESKDHADFLIEEINTAVAVRKGDWKFIQFYKGKTKEKARVELFNLKEDIGEKSNLSQEHPELVNELSEILEKMRADEKGIRHW